MTDLQSLCERGQQQLMGMQYLAAEATLVEAEKIASQSSYFDTLARLYMPLQEARRQRRQRCGEGIVRLDILATAASDQLDAQRLLQQYPHGQLLIAGWKSLAPAIEFRRLAQHRSLYAETFLGAVYPIQSVRMIVVAPTDDVALPMEDCGTIDQLIRKLPPHCLVIPESELPKGERRGDWRTFAETMAMWEHLHAPFLAIADGCTDPNRRINAYRRAIYVDYACELAHQKLSYAAQSLTRSQ